jgi:hypothetical protein
MYIGGTQTNSRIQRQSTALGAPVAPSAAPALGAAALKKAVTLNRVYARTIGWMPYTRQIAVLLGIRSTNPDIWSFVQALAAWQARNGLMPNGVLGPGEFYRMQTAPRRA